jgi:hypothetical protein
MPIHLRAVPWLLALVGLAIPLIGTGFVVWPFIAAWLVILAVIWIVGRQTLPNERGPRIALAVGALPVLFLLAWLVIEVATPAG